ncbi:hypothetical protein Tco_0093834 [Tanacetum coccineum]
MLLPITTKFLNLKNMMKTMLVEKQRAQALRTPLKRMSRSCVTCGVAHSKEYSQGSSWFFSNMIRRVQSQLPYYDQLFLTSSLTELHSGTSDFSFIEEADSFFAIEDDPTSPEVDPIEYMT